MKKALLTIASGKDYEQLANLVLPRLHAYGNLHGYELIVLRDTEQNGRPGAWAKIPALLDHLGRYEIVLWIDIDVLILEVELDVGGEFREDADIGLVFHNAEYGDLPNTGVMLVRNTIASVTFFQHIWEQSDLVHHPWWENAAVIRLLGYHHPSIPTKEDTPNIAGLKVQRLPRTWNEISLSNFYRARFLHLAGFRNDLRFLIFSLILSAQLSGRDSGTVQEIGAAMDRVARDVQENLRKLDILRPSLFLSRLGPRIRKLRHRLYAQLNVAGNKVQHHSGD